MDYPLPLLDRCPQCGKLAWTKKLRGYGYYIFCKRRCYETNYHEKLRDAADEWQAYVTRAKN